MANDKLKLDIPKLKSALFKVALKYQDNTKQYIINNDIWETKDMWNAVRADSKVKMSGSLMSVLIGVQSALLGKQRDGNNYPKLTPKSRLYPTYVHNGTKYMKARPFFDKTYEKNKDVYDKIIRDAIDVQIV